MKKWSKRAAIQIIIIEDYFTLTIFLGSVVPFCRFIQDFYFLRNKFTLVNQTFHSPALCQEVLSRILDNWLHLAILN